MGLQRVGLRELEAVPVLPVTELRFILGLNNQ